MERLTQSYNIEKRKGVLPMDTKNPVGFFRSDLDLESYLSQTITQAGKNDEALKSAKQRISECKNRLPKLTKVLDLENPAELSADECRVLIDYLLANNRLAIEECRICYMRGLIDGIETKKTFE